MQVRLSFGAFMGKKSHHGENIHKMEQVPEELGAPVKPPDLSMESRDLPVATVKRVAHPVKRQSKKPPKPSPDII
jgi:hypothetical protein